MNFVKKLISSKTLEKILRLIIPKNHCFYLNECWYDNINDKKKMNSCLIKKYNDQEEISYLLKRWEVNEWVNNECIVNKRW